MVDSTDAKNSNKKLLDSWGFFQFIKLFIYTVQLFILVGCLIVLVMYMINNVQSSIETYNRMREVLPTMIVILASAALCLGVNILASNSVDIYSAYETGQRNANECGIEYIEASTGRYALWKLFYGGDTTIKTNIEKALKLLVYTPFIAGALILLSDFLNALGNKALTRLIMFGVYGVTALFALGVLLQVPTVYLDDKVMQINSAGNTLWSYMYIYTLDLMLILLILSARVILSSEKSLFDKLKGCLDMPVYALIALSITSISVYKLINNKLDVLEDALATYNTKTSNLQTAFNAIYNNTNKTEIDKHIVHNIKQNDGAQGTDSFILKQYVNNTWPYITHKNWNEFKSMNNC